jgi:hypothetical protein
MVEAAIAVDAANDVLFAAATNSGGGTWNLGGGNLPAGQGFVVAKLAGVNGGHVWSRSAPNAANDSLFPRVRIVANAGGDAVVASSFDLATADLGGGPLPHAGGSDVFVAAYSGAAGAHLVSKAIGGAGNDFLTDLVASPKGNIAIAGGFEQAVDFGTGPIAAVPPVGAFVLSLGTVP